MRSRLAAAIQAAGVEPGDRVAQVSENRYEWIITDLAMHLAGAVHVPIHVTLSGRADRRADRGLRSAAACSYRAQSCSQSLPIDSPHTCRSSLHDEQGARGYGTLLGKPAAARQLPAPSPQPPAPDDLATILYTSGTTGRPRGVMLSQRNLASNAAATGRCARRRRGPDAALHLAAEPHLRPHVRSVHLGLPRLAARAGREPRDARSRLPAWRSRRRSTPCRTFISESPTKSAACASDDNSAAVAIRVRRPDRATVLRRCAAGTRRRDLVRRARPADSYRLWT